MDLLTLLQKNPWTLAVAESLTGGNLQALVASVSGISAAFQGGITAYNICQKVQHLGVDLEHAKSCDCVSERVATEMALGVCNMFKADIGVATTGYANSDTHDPYAYWAICDLRNKNVPVYRQGRIEAPGLNRVQVQIKIASNVLDQLTQYLLELKKTES